MERKNMSVFCMKKAQCGVESTPGLIASHEARCRMAAFAMQESGKSHHTREPRGLSPSGGKKPVKPHVTLAPCALCAQSGVKGHCPLREPRGLSPSDGNFAANLQSR